MPDTAIKRAQRIWGCRLALTRGIVLIFSIPPHNSSTLRAIGRTVYRVEAPSRRSVASRKTDVVPRLRQEGARQGVGLLQVNHRLIAGESNVSLVCSAGGRADTAGDRNRRDGLAAMTIVDNDGRLRGPADPKRIDVHSPAEMRHWVREIGRPAAKLNEAVKAVGPLVSDVRDYLRNRSLYGIPR